MVTNRGWYELFRPNRALVLELAAAFAIIDSMYAPTKFSCKFGVYTYKRRIDEIPGLDAM